MAAPAIAIALLSVPLIVPVPVATAAGIATSAPPTVGRGVGSDRWGFVGDVETRAGSQTTFSYGIGVSPTTGRLVVSDSGKMVYNNFLCIFAGFPGSPCQTGIPRVFSYDRVGTDETVATDYGNDGVYTRAVAASGSTGVNTGIGAMYEPLADRSVLTFPAAQTLQHGPRGVTFTADGVAWVVDSEAVAPIGGAAGAVLRLDETLTQLAGAGFTGAWAQRNEPGVHFYRTGAAVTPNDTVLVNSETSDRMQEYAADGTFIRSILLDLPASEGSGGYRNPYAVAVDPVDGSIYVPLINFRDDAGFRPAFLEKRDSNGNVVARIGAGVLSTDQVVFGAAVEPVTQDVFVWSQTGSLHQFTKDGAFVRSFTSAQFPGLTSVRGVAFDQGGRMLVTVAEGTSNTRVMILGKTPDPVSSVCVERTADGVSVEIAWECSSDPASAANTTGEVPYQQTPVLDYVTEMSTDGGTTWAIAPKAAASTALERTITGLDPALDYQFRVSAWNEAGSGDPVVGETAAAVEDDTASTPAGTPVPVDALGNDAAVGTIELLDAAGSPAPSVPVAGGVFTTDGAMVTFNPSSGFVGIAGTVDYRVAGATCSRTATITVTVEPVPPVAIDDIATTEPGVPVTLDLLSNDTTPAGSTLRPADTRLLDGTGTPVLTLAVAGGSWSLVGGQLTFTPDAGATGTFTVPYRITNTWGSTADAVASVTIDPPTPTTEPPITDPPTTESPTTVPDTTGPATPVTDPPLPTTSVFALPPTPPGPPPAALPVTGTGGISTMSLFAATSLCLGLVAVSIAVRRRPAPPRRR